MGRVFKRLGDAFETIGYHAERYADRRREDPITRNSRRASRYIVALAAIFGIFVPVLYVVQLGSIRMLWAVPISVSTIAVAASVPHARTPNRRVGRMLIALLLLILMFVAIFLLYR